MSEIKFRAWDAEENKFWYFTLQEILERRMSYRGSWDDKILRCEKTQYTGLKDKNGKEIYEGDILEAENRLWQIGFRDGCFVGVDFKNVAWDELVNIGYGETKVIGNAFEDSELLEVL